MGDLDLRDLRQRLKRGETIGELCADQVFDKLIDILLLEDNLIHVPLPVIICGDIHGQLEDLIKLFRTAVDGDDDRLIRERTWLFMGDYVDRGRFSLNTILLLATYKLENPTGFFLLRGNHESRSITQQYGFHREIGTNYGHYSLWLKCMDVFDLLPFGAVVAKDVFSVHGGLSPHLQQPQDLMGHNRRVEIPESGILTDVTWSDPEESGSVVWRPNSRGGGWVFGKGPTHQFCYLNGLSLVTRSHQLAQNGFEWFFRQPGIKSSLIDVWSAPNYGGKTGNIASVLRLRFPGKPEFDLPTFNEENVKIQIENVPVDPAMYFA
jgi:diadenosine tetraphosphatase ApaH/serine/threonine PP2A family protein phosphatase